MKITNRYNLPNAIVRAVQNDGYTKGDSDYSVSDLISPPRKLVLTKKHWDELVWDISKMLPALLGKAIHHIAELGSEDGITERRLYWRVMGKLISGAMDHYDPKTGILTDYKTTKVAKISFKDFQDWEWQQNSYAQLLRWHKDKITELKIEAMVVDYRPAEAESAKLLDRFYPNVWETKALPLWDEEKAIFFINQRVAMHEQAKQQLPECTPKERWARPDTWAVKKKNQKKAVAGHANYASEETARANVNALGKDYYVEYRRGRNVRCEEWCQAAAVCEQFKKLSSQ